MKWVILATQRSGTVFLTSLINNHKHLKCYNEYKFLNNKLKNHNEYYNNMSNNTGFNLKYNHVTVNNIKDLNVIHLIRKNVFKSSISQWINTHKKITKRESHSFKGNNIYDIKFSIPYNDLVFIIRNRILEIKKWINYSKKFNNCLTIFYEDLIDKKLSNRKKTIMNKNTQEKICNFLNVKSQTMSSSMKKLNPTDYENYILNWNELKKLKEKYKNYDDFFDHLLR